MPTEKNNSPAGRKPMISSAIVEGLVNYLMTGATQKDACTMVGISQDTFYKWLRISEGLNADGKHDDLPKPPRKLKSETEAVFSLRKREYAEQIRLLTEFSERIKRALATVRIAMANTIFEAANPQFDDKGKLVRLGDWKAAATYLERRDPEDWAKRSGGMNPDGSQTHKIIIEIENVGGDGD